METCVKELLVEPQGMQVHASQFVRNGLGSLQPTLFGSSLGQSLVAASAIWRSAEALKRNASLYNVGAVVPIESPSLEVRR